MEWMGTVSIGERLLRYHLLTGESAGEKRYGIRVACGEDAVSIPEIAVSKAAVCRLLQAMMRGCVTPVTARDVVEDWLCGR